MKVLLHRRFVLSLFCAAAAAGAVFGEPPAQENDGKTIVLKNGQFFEGKIKVQTSRSIHLETQFGTRVFDKKEVVETLPTGTQPDPAAAKDFDALSEAEKELLNAHAEYDLGQYEKALARVQAIQDLGDNPAAASRRDWLIIEINERQGQWETAKRLLNEKAEKGTPQEKIRAQAHLDIFKSNPDYDLRFVGEKQARNFIRDPKMRDQARERNALQDARIMRLALEEYCEQVLVDDDLSVKAFADKLDGQKTLEAVKKATGKGELVAELPYLPDLINAEASLAKAQAILGDYGKAFELDLARLELAHLLVVSEVVFREALEASPEGTAPTGGLRQWQERCDEFLKRAKPVTLIYEYMLQRVDRFPSALRDLHEIITDLSQRFEEMVKGVKRARSRTDV
jgi:hypothetical protein